MTEAVRHMRLARYMVLSVVVALTGLVSTASAAEDIAGTWQVAMDFNGNKMMATLTIAKKADGSLTGKWGASGDLKAIKFEGDKLTFSRTMSMMGNDMTQDFTGTLKDGKLSGTMKSDQFEMPITATRKPPLSPAIGQYDITYKAGDKDATARLIINQKDDGSLVGQWTKDAGQITVSNVKFQDGKLTFTRKADAEAAFEGTIKGDELTGKLKDAAVTGKRFGTAMVGTWTFTGNSDMGPQTSTLVVAPDLSGIFDIMMFELPIKAVTLEGDQVAFTAEMQMGDQPMAMEFKGKLDGKALKGKMSSPMGGDNEMTGKKVEATPAAPATPAKTN
jgi:hypothetical protein